MNNHTASFYGDDQGAYGLDPNRISIDINDLNVFHYVTVNLLGSLGVVSLLRAVSNSSTLGVSLCLVYMFSLCKTISLGVLLGVATLYFTIVMLSRRLQLGLWTSFACVLTGCIPIVSQLVFGEDSEYYFLDGSVGHLFKKFGDEWSVYVDNPSNSLTIIYTYAWTLIPLFVWALGSYCLDSKNGFCFFPGAYYSGRVLTCNLVTDAGESRKADLKNVRDWALKKMPSKTTSSHWWFNDLDVPVREAFQRCAESSQICNMFRSLFSERHYCVDIVEGMNEVYVTGPARKDETFNSDQIFYSKHVDGPWGFIPFVSVFRCIVGMDRNLATSTHFPMKPLSKNATEGEVIGFDFNREIHYITKDESKEKDSDEFRVVLKLHYCMYPRVLAPLGWLMHKLNVAYNQTFRALFVKTINPITYYEHFLAWNVIINTCLFNNIETFIGQRNVVYLILVASVSYIIGNYYVFLIMTSFVHYIR